MSTPRTTSATDATLHQRRRPLTPAELDAIPWLNLLAPADRERAVDDLRIAEAEPGDLRRQVEITDRHTSSCHRG